MNGDFAGMERIKRECFVQWLNKWRGKDIIKVVTGIRRCGKSTLFDIYRATLLAEGVAEDKILAFNFEDPDLGEFASFRDAWDFVVSKMPDRDAKYSIFLDEVQNIPQFERLVDGLFAQKRADIYITGSNAKFLSGELGTFLTGRYVEIEMQTLSFAEWLTSQVGDKAAMPIATNELLLRYVREGGFPFVAAEHLDARARRDYLTGVMNTILYKDVAERKQVRDLAMLNRVVRFLFDNIGNLTSVNRIVGALKNGGTAITNATVDAYIEALIEAFLVYRVPRYDIKGKQYLQTNAKYYLADTGLRYALLGEKAADYGHVLENVVFLELNRRYDAVYVGQLPNGEVDFVAVKDGMPTYWQVALTLRDEAVLARELKPLLAISDQYPKHLLTLDPDPPFDHNGIRQSSVADFLMQAMI